MNKINFQKVKDGKDANMYIMTKRNGLEISVTNYSKIIVSLYIPDRNGILTDIVRGIQKKTKVLVKAESQTVDNLKQGKKPKKSPIPEKD